MVLTAQSSSTAANMEWDAEKPPRLTASEVNPMSWNWARWMVALGAFCLGAAPVLTMPWHYIGFGLSALGLIVLRFPLHRCPLWIPILALTTWMVVVAWLAPYGYLGRLDGMVYALPLVAVGWAIAQDRRALMGLLVGLLLGVTLSGVLGILQFFIGYDGGAKPWRIDPDGRQYRYATGFMNHWIRYGLMMGLAGTTLFILGPVLLGRRWSWPWVALAIASTMISGARGAVLALAAGLGVGISVGGTWKRVLGALCGAVAVAVLGMVVIALAAPERVQLMLQGDDIRLTTWGHLMELLWAHPWFGVGPKGLPTAYAQGIENAGFHQWNPGHAHNGFLQIALTGGIPALALFLTFIGWLGVVLWRQRLASPLGRIGWQLGLAVLALWTVASLTEDAFGMSTIRNAPLLILGVACGLGVARWAPAQHQPHPVDTQGTGPGNLWHQPGLSDQMHATDRGSWPPR